MTTCIHGRTQCLITSQMKAMCVHVARVQLVIMYPQWPLITTPQCGTHRIHPGIHNEIKLVVTNIQLPKSSTTKC